MINLFWRPAARVLSKPAVVEMLIKRAAKTPYHHLASADGQDVYMARYWLFNPYDRETQQVKYRWFPWSIRLHFIHREDLDRDLHDHPWNARTVILRGGYTEQRPFRTCGPDDPIWEQLDPLGWRHSHASKGAPVTTYEFIDRIAGDTAALKHGDYHRIDSIAPGGAITLFITGRYRGPWGFLVDGVKVGWRKYRGLDEDQDLQSHDVCPASPSGTHVLAVRPVLVRGTAILARVCTHCGRKND